MSINQYFHLWPLQLYLGKNSELLQYINHSVNIRFKEKKKHLGIEKVFKVLN